jgi:hypothetical protein
MSSGFRAAASGSASASAVGGASLSAGSAIGQKAISMSSWLRTRM